MKRLVTAAILAFPAVASAHPGHEHFGSTNHTVGEWATVGVLAAVCAGAFLLLRSRNQD